MCDVWNAEEWLANSQPANTDSPYTLKETRYNEAGQVARTYLESDGYAWGVLPGEGNYQTFNPSRYSDPLASALEYIGAAGYTLSENPTQSTESVVPAEVVEYSA